MLKNNRYLSAASLWEVAIKSAQGKLPLISEEQVAEAARDLVLTILSITPQHVYRISRCPYTAEIRSTASSSRPR